MEKVFTKDAYVICYGPDETHICNVAAGNSLGSGQPNMKEFETLEECYDFARGLGWVEPSCYPAFESDWPAGLMPDLDSDGMQRCYNTEPLWVTNPDWTEGFPGAPVVDAKNAVVDVKATAV